MKRAIIFFILILTFSCDREDPVNPLNQPPVKPPPDKEDPRAALDAWDMSGHYSGVIQYKGQPTVVELWFSLPGDALSSGNTYDMEFRHNIDAHMFDKPEGKAYTRGETISFTLDDVAFEGYYDKRDLPYDAFIIQGKFTRFYSEGEISFKTGTYDKSNL